VVWQSFFCHRTGLTLRGLTRDLRKTNLAKIFSEARSGAIAHKNKKRITAVTHSKEKFI
jgi:hypothetical protein